MITKYSTIHEYLLFWNSPSCTSLSSDRLRTDRARYIRKYLAPCIGSVCLNRYSENHLYKLRRFLEDDTETSEVMGFIVLRTFRQAMTFAEENMYIFNAFLDDLYIPYIMDRKIRLYTPAQITSLFSAIEYELLCNYYKLIYYTVMTSAEARALRVSDIDIENRTLHIRQRIYGKARHSHSIKPLIDPQQARDIYLSYEAMACVLDELRRREERCLKPFWKDTGQDLLFTYRNGGPITDSYLAQTRKTVEAITGIKDFSTLSLRYSAANAALKAGASEKTIQDMLGFTSLRYVFRMKDKFIEG